MSDVTKQGTVVQARSAALAAQAEQLNGELLEQVRGITAEQWRRNTASEQWPVAVVAHHVADVTAFFTQVFGDIADGAWTGELIPLCHSLSLDAVTVDFTFEADGVRATARASLTGRTGVEMEALTATSIALLTIYDMAKAVERSMKIEGIRLVEKRGGKSGTYRAGK